MPRPGFYTTAAHEPRVSWQPPSHLSKAARAIWRQTVASVPPGHFAAGDRELLADFSETAAQLRVANAELWRSGLVATGERGTPVQSAHLAAKKTLAGHLRALSGALRLNPKSRSDGRKKPADPELSPDDLATLQGRG
jgi:P27 family predicted phage terminase small subunit